MDGFSYYNIFDTKGIEYLIIIAFLILFIPFSIILNKKVKIKQEIQKALGALTSAILKIPQGVFFSRYHTWAHLAKSGEATVGMDDLLLHLTGEVNVSFLKEPGDLILKGEEMVALDHEGKCLKLCSPISGTISGTNLPLTESSRQLVDDPYESGWVYRIRPSDWAAETGSCLLAGAASEWMKHELDRFKDFLAGAWPKYAPEASMVALQDGGELQDHLLPEFPDGLWQDFQSEFLTPREKM